ncbi:MAG TPA: hypothetical protein VFZ22_18685 [Pyrinomonadaceae bacterium]|nr:hypothetical protein [Pyrinomonadaceae bacterium]
MCFTRSKTILFAAAFTFVLAMQSTAAAPALPNPILIFVGQEETVAGGKQLIRYHYDVFNKDEYPADFFAASPKLPPCGTNTKAARTWVDVYDQNGKRLNGFCALGKPADLGTIYFSLGRDELPPSWIYIELTDRLTNTKYKSNLAETTL